MCEQRIEGILTSDLVGGWSEVGRGLVGGYLNIRTYVRTPTLHQAYIHQMVLTGPGSTNHVDDDDFPPRNPLNRSPNFTMKTAIITTLLSVATPSMAFAPTLLIARTETTTELNLFDGFENPLDKVFEEEGPLGKGITVGKVQVAINVPGSERTSKDSIFAKLAQHARAEDTSSGYDDDYEDGYGDSKLSKMCHDVCLTLLRQSDSWTAACSESEWFKLADAGKAESLYNQWADRGELLIGSFLYHFVS